eukprot:jgi/Tetstr1/438534/TSEL_027086.t1
MASEDSAHQDWPFGDVSTRHERPQHRQAASKLRHRAGIAAPALLAAAGVAFAGWRLARRRRGQRRQAKLSAPVWELAAAASKCAECIAPVSATDLVCGLARASARVAEREPPQRGDPNDPLLSDPDLLGALRHWLCVAEAAYAGVAWRFCLIAHMPESALLASAWCATSERPAYMLAADPSRRTLVVAVRGTAEPVDMLINAAFSPAPFQHGTAHSGMLAAARAVLAAIRQPLEAALAASPAFSVTFTGHSLGGSVAALLALQVQEELPSVQVHCFAFSPAACLSLELARAAASVVTAVAATHDIVPCLSLPALNKLAKQMDTSTGQRQPRAPRKEAPAGADLYPPGQLLLLGWTDSPPDGPPRRVRRPKLWPSRFFTRKMGIDWVEDAARVRWTITLAQPDDFGQLTVSPWSWSDHMLTTLAQGLVSAQADALGNGNFLL